MDKHIDTLKMSNATRNLLKRRGVQYYSALSELSLKDMAAMQFGPTRCYEVLKIVKDEMKCST